MSTGYKDVLDKLDNYHAVLARCNAPQDLNAPDVDGHSGAKLDQLDHLLDLHEALEALEKSLQSYEEAASIPTRTPCAPCWPRCARSGTWSRACSGRSMTSKASPAWA